MDAISFDAPLELKSADAGDNELVAKSFERFDAKVATVTEQIAGVEKKSMDRLDSLEAAIKRINIGGRATAGDDEGADQRKAFNSFLRTGVADGALEGKSMTVSGAGALAPTQYGDELIKLLRLYSPVRNYAKVVTISAPSVAYPKRTGSTSAVWVGETAARTSTDMTFGSLTMTPFELAAYSDVSNWLLEDNAYNLEGELLSDFAESFGIAEGLAFVSGNGTTQPAGIMADASITNVLKTGVATDLPATDSAITDKIIDMFHVLPAVFANVGTWAMNRTLIARLRKLKMTTGEYLLASPLSEGAAATILGRPVVELPDMDAVGANKFPILFGDFSGYRIVDRVSFEVIRNPYIIQANGQVRFHARKRVGAGVTNPDRFVKLQCST